MASHNYVTNLKLDGMNLRVLTLLHWHSYVYYSEVTSTVAILDAQTISSNASERGCISSAYGKGVDLLVSTRPIQHCVFFVDRLKHKRVTCRFSFSNTNFHRTIN